MTASAAAGVSVSLSFHQVLSRWGPDYLERYGAAMPARQREVLRKILACRSPQLGGSLYLCPDCGTYHYAYHSCNDRHCPQCGQTDAQLWLQQHSQLLLPVPYFLVTFTLPEPVRQWIRSHPKQGYDIFFAASARALQDLAANPKPLHGSLGMLGLLHTWSRTLIYHPHIHYLIPAGALSLDQRQWKPSRKKFLLRVEPLSDRFRNLFRSLLTNTQPQALTLLPPKIWKQRWVTYSLAVGSGQNALRYLSRYIFKTATANRTLRLLPNGRLRWPYRHSHTRQWTSIDLHPIELIRRFLQHILPQSFHRVRLFGWLHPAGRKNLNRVRALLGQPPCLTQAEHAAWQPLQDLIPPHELEQAPTPPPPFCPRCHKPMRLLSTWLPGQPQPLPPNRAPP